MPLPKEQDLFLSTFKIIMTFQESIRVCFTKYFDFSGRATRSEYWWFFLFLVLGGLLGGVLSPIASGLFTLATLVPSTAVATRRLHDTRRSGWWQLIILVPLLGFIVLFVFLAQEGKEDVSPSRNLA
jgi:uncharacterized membrane protein YhaH (DUF805 family)